MSELRLPAGRRALIAKRLARFSSSTQAVLATAAIVGREFDVGLLVGAGAGSEPAVKLAISEAAIGRVASPNATNESEGASRCRTRRLRTSLVDTIPRDRGRQLHLRIAQSLEKRRPDRVGEIALHYDAAGESTDAYRAAQVAARAATRVYAHGAAGALSADGGTQRDLARRARGDSRCAGAPRRNSRTVRRSRRAVRPGHRVVRPHRPTPVARSRLRRMRERARIELGQPAREDRRRAGDSRRRGKAARLRSRARVHSAR